MNASDASARTSDLLLPQENLRETEPWAEEIRDIKISTLAPPQNTAVLKVFSLFVSFIGSEEFEQVGGDDPTERERERPFVGSVAFSLALLRRVIDWPLPPGCRLSPPLQPRGRRLPSAVATGGCHGRAPVGTGRHRHRRR